MAEECRAECIQEVQHREEAVEAKEPGRVVLPRRENAVPPFLERILGRKA